MAFHIHGSTTEIESQQQVNFKQLTLQRTLVEFILAVSIIHLELLKISSRMLRKKKISKLKFNTRQWSLLIQLMKLSLLKDRLSQKLDESSVLNHEW